MLKLKVKEYIREYFESKMLKERVHARTFNVIPALIIKDEEMERFIDDMWFFMNKLKLQDEQNEQDTEQ